MEGFKDLLLRAKRGDEDAVEKLFVRYESLLNKCSRVNGRVDEDLYQVLLIEFWRAISEFKVYEVRLGQRLVPAGHEQLLDS